MELLGKDLDKLAKVDTFIGNVVEYRLDFIALILHITDFHIETHLRRNLARANHRLVFQSDGLLPTLDVVGFGLAVDFFVFAVVGIETGTTHLLSDHVARKRDDADIVTRRGLHCYDVT